MEKTKGSSASETVFELVQLIISTATTCLAFIIIWVLWTGSDNISGFAFGIATVIDGFLIVYWSTIKRPKPFRFWRSLPEGLLDSISYPLFAILVVRNILGTYGRTNMLETFHALKFIGGTITVVFLLLALTKAESKIATAAKIVVCLAYAIVAVLLALMGDNISWLAALLALGLVIYFAKSLRALNHAK